MTNGMGACMDKEQIRFVFVGLLGLSAHWDEFGLQITRAGTEYSALISNGEIADLVDLTSEASVEEGTAAFTSQTAEFLVESRGNGSRVDVRDDIQTANSADKLTYRLGKPSAQFALLIGHALVQIEPRPTHPRMRTMIRLRSRRESDPTPLELLADSLRIDTLRITGEKNRTRTELKSLAESFYFHIGFNLDYAIIQRTDLSSFARSSRIQRVRRTTTEELDAPKRAYVSELVSSYQLALASESPMLSYLSFYHVAEHYFEEIFLNEIAVKIRDSITAPGFSTKRMQDLHGLIKTVSKSLKSRDESMIINESTALNLTLKRYVSLPDLVASLAAFDNDLIDTYATKKVSFASAPTVDLRGTDSDQVYKNLTDRIYKTRNALVHRKNGTQGKFTPFKDDKALEPELPLLRFLAEQIVISTSDPS